MMARILSLATIKLMYRILSAGIAMFATSAYVSQCQAGTVTFGTGANQFQMKFVTIGNPGNAPDTTGNPSSTGSVGYEYGIGKFEVSVDMINKYNASQPGGILRITTDQRGPAKPATSISWNEAARFVNWLNTSTGGFAAYKFTTDGVNDNSELWSAADTLDYDATNPYRSLRAMYVLPSYNEWYKAAYYNPSNSIYYDYTNGSNTAPTAVSRGTGAGTAVYDQPFEPGPANVNQAGGLSPYGVMGLGGNVFEWQETSGDLLNNGDYIFRISRGGSWTNSSIILASSGPFDSFYPSFKDGMDLGFRVASVSPSDIVPEPSSLVIGTLFGLGGLLAKRRMKR
jgi:sulfatase modifying factor 1